MEPEKKRPQKFPDEQDKVLEAAMANQSLNVQYMIASVRQRGYIPTMEQYRNYFGLHGSLVEVSYRGTRGDVEALLKGLAFEVNEKSTVVVTTGFLPYQLENMSFATSVSMNG